jgi:phosphoribosylcarboxyaminoimidazole (NCAIR) mutase
MHVLMGSTSSTNVIIIIIIIKQKNLFRKIISRLFMIVIFPGGIIPVSHLSLGQATAAVVVAMVCAFFCDQKQVLQLARWGEKESRDVASSKL